MIREPELVLLNKTTFSLDFYRFCQVIFLIIFKTLHFKIFLILRYN
jgi:hypothetical protein